MENQIDAVVVSTPNHIHVPASVMAMRMGKHCYCEKPLAHSVYETRVAARGDRPAVELA
jgi:predicted dehydrogenase